MANHRELPPDDSCSYCIEIKGETDGNVFHKVTGMLNYLVKETKNFVILPSLGMFVEGYLLIVPKQHYFSIAQIPDNLFKDVYELRKFVMNLNKEIYNSSTTFFEHGSCSSHLRGAACVLHAHLQSVPLNLDLKPQLVKYLGDPAEIDEYDELKIMYSKGTPYIFYERFDEKKFVWEVSVAPSQLFRQFLAKAVALNELWDWRSHPMKEKILSFISKYERWKELHGYENAKFDP